MKAKRRRGILNWTFPSVHKVAIEHIGPLWWWEAVLPNESQVQEETVGEGNRKLGQAIVHVTVTSGLKASAVCCLALFQTGNVSKRWKYWKYFLLVSYSFLARLRLWHAHQNKCVYIQKHSVARWFVPRALNL